MSRTVDLVKAFVPKRPSSLVETLQQRKFELIDPNDSQGAMRRLPDVTIQAKYCWRLDVEGATHWISQDQDEKLQEANLPASQDEDPGLVVGTLAKVSVDGNTLHYGPVELYTTAWERIQAQVQMHT